MFKKILLVAGVLYGLGLVGLYVFQNNFIYFPYVSCLQGVPQRPADFREVTVDVTEGVNHSGILSLTGWYRPAVAGQPTIIFMHGNADGLQASAAMTRAFADAGYGLMLVGYRGYNCAAGTPSEAGLYADARAFIRAVLADNFAESNLVLMGYSLGTGVATQMATEFKARALVLVAPFLSLPDMAQVRFPFYPAYSMVTDKFANKAKIKSINMPLFVTHGDADITVPFYQGEELAALAMEPKQFLPVAGANHMNLFTPQFFGAVDQWLKDQWQQRREDMIMESLSAE